MNQNQNQPQNRFFKISLYYFSAFLQGLCIILISGSSFILKSPAANAITDQQYGILFLPMIIMAVLVTWFFKKILNRLGEETLFYTGALTNVLFLAALYGVEKAAGNNALSFQLLCISNFFLGIGFGVFISVLNVLSIELFPRKRDSILAGLHGCLGIGAALSPLLISFFYARGFWSGSAVFTAALFAALIFAAKISAAPVPAVHLHQSRPHSHGPFPPGILLFMAALFFYGVTESMLGNWTVSYLVEEKHFSTAIVSWVLSIFWFFITVGRLLATWLVIKIDPRYLYRLSPLVIIASLAAILSTHSEAKVLYFYVAVGLGCSYFFPLSISLSSQYFDRWRDQLASLCVASLMTGVGFGSTFTGLLRDHFGVPLQTSFMGAAVSAALAFIAAFLVTRRPIPDL